MQNKAALLLIGSSGGIVICSILTYLFWILHTMCAHENQSFGMSVITGIVGLLFLLCIVGVIVCTIMLGLYVWHRYVLKI